MKPTRHLILFLRSFQSLPALGLILLAGPITAAEITWDGQNSVNMSAAVNWAGDVAPVSGDGIHLAEMGVLISGSTGSLYNSSYLYGVNNDLATGTVYNGMTFEQNWGGNAVNGSAFVLSGDLVDNSPFLTQNIAAYFSLSGTRNVSVSSRTAAIAVSGVISEATAGSGITKTGPGLLTLTGTNTYSGPMTVTGGTTSIGNDARLGAAPATVTPGSIVLDGGSLRVTFALTISANRGMTLGSNGGTLDSAPTSGSTSYNGIIAGAGNFVKTGGASLILGGASTYGGTTTLNQGTLKLDFSQTSAPSSNILPAASNLVLNGLTTAYSATSFTAAGSTLNVTSGSGTSNVQSFASTTLNGGQQTISTSSTASGKVLLNLGAITHNGGAVNFSPGGTFAAGSNAITTTNANDASGILGGWATYNGNHYASNDGAGNIVAYSGYTVVNSGAISSLASSNVRSQTNGAVSLSVADAQTTDINTYSIGNAVTGVKTLTVGSAGTGSTGVLRLGAEGGMMLASGAGGLVVGDVAGNGTLTAGGAANTAGALHFISQSGIDTFTVNSNIADNGTGAVALRVAGYGPLSNAAVLTLNGTNSYTGGTVIYGGRVTAGTTTAFGSGAVTVRNGAQALLPAAGTYANDFNIAGAGANTADTPAALYLQGNTLSGKITLQGDATLTPRSTTGNILSGQITGGYSLSVTAPNGTAGEVILTNPSNNWNGNLTIDSQTLKIGASEVIPNGVNAGSVILNNTATSILDLNGFNETINGLATNGSGCFVQNGAAATTSTLTIGDGNVSSRFEGILRDNGGTGGTLALVKTGTGTIHIPSSNTFTGGLTIKGGVVFGGVPSGTGTPFGAVTGTITLGDTSGSLSAILRQSNLAKTLAHPIVVAAGSTGEKIIDDIGSGQSYTYSGPVTLNDSLSLKTYAGGGSPITLTGAITGNGAVNLVGVPRGANVNVNGAVAGANTGVIMNGTGTFYFSAQNSFGGNVVVNSGTLQAATLAPNNGTTGALGNSSIAGRTITVNNGATLLLSVNNIFGNGAVTATSMPTLVVNGGTVKLTRYSTVGRVELSNGGTLTNTSTDTNTFQAAVFRNGVSVTGTSASTITATAVSAIQYGYHLASNTTFTVNDVTSSSATDLNVVAPLRDQSADFSSQAGGFTKAGTGTMTLAGANTYSGATTVSAGTLLVDGSTGTSAIGVGASGTLGGTGTIGGAVTAAGRIAPGDTGTGTLTTGNATVTGTLAVQVDGAASDKLMVNGNLDVTGATLDVSLLSGGFTAGSYVIAEYSGTLAGTFSSVPAGYAVAYNAGTSGKQIILTQTTGGYGSWASSKGLDGTNNGPNQDPDHDGISNLLEFVFGGDPLSASSTIVPSSSLDASNLTFHFTRSDASKADTTLVVEWGTDMATWTDIAIGEHSSVDGVVTVTDGSPDDDIVVTIPRSNASDGRLFVRLKATH
ncbi:MAG: autotransporter-associated beta strand repeat-containing protein [Luteolibacter sp.]